MAEKINEEISAEEYLQISSNILSTFKSRIPVSLCTFSDEMNRVEIYLEKETRITPKKKQKIVELCDSGNLFVPKNEYQILAEHLSKNLGSLLTEHFLDESVAAKVFHDGLTENIRSFFSNPIFDNLEEIKKNLAIFNEYLWIDQERALFFFNALDKNGSLAEHSVNTLFTGISLYLALNKNKTDLKATNEFALGLILHDIGMTQVSSSLINKRGALLYKEKQRVQEHIDIAEKMVSRLEISNETTLTCITDHHERLNGSGYPKGKKADRLNLESRVCAVADVFCAMISSRPYRNPINPILASIVLTKQSELFDKNVVNALLKFIISHNSEMKQIIQDKQKLAKLHELAANMSK
jgi:HD-GYP domain-containing protein (c-di-GMP phosphodiesterase class II)